MSKALYNRYRSQNFNSLIGQEHITKLLKNAVKTGKIANAYLFVGTRGTGKTSTARILAKAVNCLSLKEDGNPCDECKNCVAIKDGSFMDLIEIDAASNRGIDQIRELKEKIEFTPSEGNYKVYIIDEVHMLTKEAFNALLKTLEEPPKHVIFILATTDVHKLPPTILSRCQRYDFKMGSVKDIKEALEVVIKSEKVSIEPEALNIIANNAKGSYRDALSLFDVIFSGQSDSKNPKEITKEEVLTVLGIPDQDLIINLINSLKSGSSKKILNTISDIESQSINVSQFVSNSLSYLKDQLFDCITGKNKDFSEDELVSMMEGFLQIDREIKYSSYPYLALETGLLKLAGKGNKVEVIEKEVIKKVKKVEEKVEVKHEVKKDESPKEPKEAQVIPEKAEVKYEEPKNAKNIVDDSEESDVDITDDDSSESGDSESNLTVKDVKDNWDKLVDAIKGINPRVAAFMKSANATSVTQGIVSIDVPFQFHKDRLEMISNKEIVNNTLKQVLGSSLKFVCNVNNNMNKRKRVSADVVLQAIAQQPQNNAKAPSAETAPSSSSSSKPVDPKMEERKAAFAKKVEDIFAGM